MKKIIITNCAALFALGVCELSAFDYSSGSATETVEEAEDGGWMFDSGKTEAKPSVAQQAAKPTVKTPVANSSKTVTVASEDAEGRSWFFDSDKNESIAAADKKEFRETTDTSEYEKTGKEALEGWFAGIGLTQVASNSKATAIEHTYEWSGDVNIGAPFAAQDMANELYPYDIIGQVQFRGDGVHNLHWIKVSNFDNSNMISGKLSKLGGSATLGGGAFIGDTYFGSEFVIDFSGNKENTETDSSLSKGFGTARLKSKGIKPSLNFLFGMYSSLVDSLIYAKLGVGYIQTELKTDNGSGKLSKLAPIVGLGIRKNIYQNMSLNCEFDYTFESDKKIDITKDVPVALNGNNVNLTHTARVRIKQKGYAVRLLVTYAF